MKNYAGRDDVDTELIGELTAAGIPFEKLPESMRKTTGEVQSIIIGSLHGWSFQRYWYYWVCKGPGIEVEIAEKLHQKFGTVVRTDGFSGGISPRKWFGGLACDKYHVDTQEGLNALAETIKELVEKSKLKDQ